MSSETNDLLKKLEEENNGTLEFRTYAQFIGESGKKIMNLGGLLYFVNNALIFEDFERQSSSLQLLFRKKSEYVKLKFKIPMDSIKRIDLVNLISANASIRDGRDPERLTAVRGARKFFFRNVTQILLNDGRAFYFEIFNLKEFTAFIAEKG